MSCNCVHCRYLHEQVNAAQAKITRTQLETRVLVGWTAGVLNQHQAAGLLDLSEREIDELRERALRAIPPWPLTERQGTSNE